MRVSKIRRRALLSLRTPPFVDAGCGADPFPVEVVEQVDGGGQVSAALVVDGTAAEVEGIGQLSEGAEDGFRVLGRDHPENVDDLA